MTLDVFAVIFGGAGALLPIYANEVLHVGPDGYGLLTAALEIGTFASALAMMALPSIRHAGGADTRRGRFTNARRLTAPHGEARQREQHCQHQSPRSISRPISGLHKKSRPWIRHTGESRYPGGAWGAGTGFRLSTE